LYQDDAEVLFPARVVSALRHLRGEKWQKLVEAVLARPEHDADLLAFVLLMIRIDGCMSCHADSYRAMRGCTICAQQAITRFKGTDEDLIRLWEIARMEIVRWQQTGEPPEVE
jgi:hypothetical protein